MTATTNTAIAAIEAIEVGRCTIDEKLHFHGQVIGGGSGGPGRVVLQTGFKSSIQIYAAEDRRSGSRRSGYCIWNLQADALYEISNCAVSSSRTGTFYVKTDGGQAVELSREEFDAERKRRWPMEAQLAAEAAERHRIAEIERMEREAAQAEARRIEAEALKELNDERAAEIAEKGQEKFEGLPELTGTPKQIAYALNIRAAYAAKHQGDAALKRGTTPKYWIENHRSVLYR